MALAALFAAPPVFRDEAGPCGLGVSEGPEGTALLPVLEGPLFEELAEKVALSLEAAGIADNLFGSTRGSLLGFATLLGFGTLLGFAAVLGFATGATGASGATNLVHDLGGTNGAPLESLYQFSGGSFRHSPTVTALSPAA